MKKKVTKRFIYKPVLKTWIDVWNGTKEIKYDVKKIEILEEHEKFYIDKEKVYWKDTWVEDKQIAINFIKSEFQSAIAGLWNDETSKFEKWVKSEERKK